MYRTQTQQELQAYIDQIYSALLMNPANQSAQSALAQLRYQYPELPTLQEYVYSCSVYSPPAMSSSSSSSSSSSASPSAPKRQRMDAIPQVPFRPIQHDRDVVSPSSLFDRAMLSSTPVPADSPPLLGRNSRNSPFAPPSPVKKEFPGHHPIPYERMCQAIRILSGKMKPNKNYVNCLRLAYDMAKFLITNIMPTRATNLRGAALDDFDFTQEEKTGVLTTPKGKRKTYRYCIDQSVKIKRGVSGLLFEHAGTIDDPIDLTAPGTNICKPKYFHYSKVTHGILRKKAELKKDILIGFITLNRVGDPRSPQKKYRKQHFETGHIFLFYAHPQGVDYLDLQCLDNPISNDLEELINFYKGKMSRYVFAPVVNMWIANEGVLPPDPANRIVKLLKKVPLINNGQPISENLRKLLFDMLIALAGKLYNSPSDQKALYELNQLEKSFTTEQIQTSLAPGKIFDPDDFMPLPSDEKDLFYAQYPNLIITDASAEGHNCLIDCLLQLTTMPANDLYTKCCRSVEAAGIRQTLIDKHLTAEGSFLYTYYHARIILELIGLNSNQYTIQTWWSYDGELQAPEVEGNGPIQIWLWNSGGHYQPIFAR